MSKRTAIIKDYLEELGRQDPNYFPGTFWEKALQKIAGNYISNGINDFRREDVNLNFFVPTYGPPGNGFIKEEISYLVSHSRIDLESKQRKYIEMCFDGSLQALADYRAFCASNSKSDLIDYSGFSESKVGEPAEHFSFGGKNFSRSALNYLLGLSFLKKVAPDFVPSKVLEIGGGFGTLGEILLNSSIKNFKYIDLDLPPMFLIAEEYLKNCCDDNEIFFDHINNRSDKIHINNLTRFSFLPNWRIENLIGEVDLFVNFISFQEMEPAIVKNYTEKITRLKPKFILLRNLREGKQVSKKGSLGVKEPIFKEDYISYFKHYDLIESNVVPYGFITYDGFHSELLILKKRNE